MSTSAITRAVTAGVGMGFIAGGALMSAAPALAIPIGYDGPDTTGYINALVDDGVNPYPISQAIQIGYQICAALSQGKGVTQTIGAIAFVTELPDSLVSDVVIDAHVYLCPEAPFDSTADTYGPFRGNVATSQAI